MGSHLGQSHVIDVRGTLDLNSGACVRAMVHALILCTCWLRVRNKAFHSDHYPPSGAPGAHPSIQIRPIMENELEKDMEHEMKTGVVQGLYKDPDIQIISTCGPKVYR